ncbi:unnamed protein product, partial [Iphiclides podalirius]
MIIASDKLVKENHARNDQTRVRGGPADFGVGCSALGPSGDETRAPAPRLIQRARIRHNSHPFPLPTRSYQWHDVLAPPRPIFNHKSLSTTWNGKEPKMSKKHLHNQAAIPLAPAVFKRLCARGLQNGAKSVEQAVADHSLAPACASAVELRRTRRALGQRKFPLARPCAAPASRPAPPPSPGVSTHTRARTPAEWHSARNTHAHIHTGKRSFEKGTRLRSSLLYAPASQSLQRHLLQNAGVCDADREETARRKLRHKKGPSANLNRPKPEPASRFYF